jgi:hypothetical protein
MPKRSERSPKRGATKCQSSGTSGMPGGVMPKSIAEKIADTKRTLAHLEELLHASMKSIRDSDGTEVVQVADSHGKVRTKRKSSPVFRRQRDITSSIRSLEEHLEALLTEEQIVLRNRSLDDDVNELDALLGIEKGQGARHIGEEKRQ